MKVKIPLTHVSERTDVSKVSGDTLIWTDKGIHPISQYVDKNSPLQVQAVVPTKFEGVMSHPYNEVAVMVTTQSGRHLTCSRDHTWLFCNTYMNNFLYECSTNDLQPGDTIVCKLSTPFSPMELGIDDSTWNKVLSMTESPTILYTASKKQMIAYLDQVFIRYYSADRHMLYNLPHDFVEPIFNILSFLGIESHIVVVNADLYAIRIPAWSYTLYKKFSSDRDYIQTYADEVHDYLYTNCRYYQAKDTAQLLKSKGFVLDTITGIHLCNEPVNMYDVVNSVEHFVVFNNILNSDSAEYTNI